MKKLTFAFLLIVLLLVGCVKMDISVEVKKDGSIDTSLIMGMEKSIYEMASQAGEDPFAEMKTDVEADGFAFEEYSDDKYIGFKATNTFKSIEDFQFLNDDTGDFNIDISDGTFGKSYKVNGKLDMSSEMEPGTEMFMDDFDLTFTLVLPGKIGKNNATRVDGNKLIWDLSMTGPTEIQAESSESGIVSLFLFGGIGIVILGGLLVFLKRKKTSNEQELPPLDNIN